MKKYYKMFGIALIMAFSFYYTEQISLIVLNKSPLMITINEEKEKYSIKSVNALIDGNYIIPGVNGIEVNARDSYYRMQELEIFDKYYLSFDQVKPNISLEDNKDNLEKCEFLIPVVLNEFTEEERGKVKVIETTANWYGVTYKEDKDLVMNALKELTDNGTYPNDLWK